MQTELDIIQDLFGKRAETFTIKDMEKAMRVFANQFRWVKTTCGKNVEFDDLDYDVLRQQDIFWDSNRECVMALWFSKEGNRTVAPVAKLMIEAEGKAIIHYKDKNPLNLKRDNIELINRKKAHYKQKKQKTANGGNKPTSIYKGVSWSKFAKKWCAYIKVDGGKKHLGYFSEEIDGARAYNKEATKCFGRYAKLNDLSK